MGSSQGKHIMLHKLHDKVAQALSNPQVMLYPQSANTFLALNNSIDRSRDSAESLKSAANSPRGNSNK